MKRRKFQVVSRFMLPLELPYESRIAGSRNFSFIIYVVCKTIIYLNVEVSVENYAVCINVE